MFYYTLVLSNMPHLPGIHIRVGTDLGGRSQIFFVEVILQSLYLLPISQNGHKNKVSCDSLI